jgi:hypothetical protein
MLTRRETSASQIKTHYLKGLLARTTTVHRGWLLALFGIKHRQGKGVETARTGAIPFLGICRHFFPVFLRAAEHDAD